MCCYQDRAVGKAVAQRRRVRHSPFGCASMPKCAMRQRTVTAQYWYVQNTQRAQPKSANPCRRVSTSLCVRAEHRWYNRRRVLLAEHGREYAHIAQGGMIMKCPRWGAERKASGNESISADMHLSKAPMRNGLAIIAMLFVVLGLSGCGKTFDLSPYISISYSGYDGYAAATATFDAAQFVADNADDLKPADGSEGTSKTELAQIAAADVQVTLDKSSEISNGDTLTATVDASKLSDDLKGNFKAPKTVSVTVADLAEAKVIDVFSFINITTSGIDGAGKVRADYGALNEQYNCHVTPPSSKLSDEYLEVEPSEGLRNGDTVTVTITQELIKELDWNSDAPVVPLEMSETLTVSGLVPMVTTGAGLTDVQLATVKGYADDYLQNSYAYYYSNSDSTFTVDSTEYEGYGFMLQKDADVADYVDLGSDGVPEYAHWGSDPYSSIYLVYKTDISVETRNGDNHGPFTRYIVLTFFNPYFDADDVVQVPFSKPRVEGACTLFQGEYSSVNAAAYESLNDIQADLVKQYSSYSNEIYYGVDN